MTCQVDGCEKPATRGVVCEACYCRKRRNGTYEYRVPPREKVHSGGYVLEYRPDHPLAVRLGRGREYQHRMAYYDAHGEGPFECNWCGITVTWGDMHVDHVNGVKDDNSISNLVASCPVCNQARGISKMRETIRERHGVWLEFNGQRKTITDWAEQIGITTQSLRWRINNGWPLHRALAEPRGKHGPTAKAGKVGGAG